MRPGEAVASDYVELQQQFVDLRADRDNLQFEHERFRHMFELAPSALLHLDPRGVVLHANRTAAQMMGLPLSELIGTPLILRVSPAHRRRLTSHINQVTRGTTASIELEFRTPSGTSTPVLLRSVPSVPGASEPTSCQSAAIDISDLKLAEQKLQQVRDELEQLANFEPLTGLPTRRVFLDRLRRALARARRHHSHGAVVYLDLDGFKNINDEMGHEAGDELLRQVGQRLVGRVREGDTVCRLGGDEFTVLLEELEQDDDAVCVAEEILAALSTPMTIGGRTVVVEGSAGIRVLKEEDGDPATILRQADIAMYRAKREGGSRVLIFSDGMQEPDAKEPVDELLEAVLGGQLFLEFQPKVDARDQTLRGFEALVRWRHPSRGVLPPSQFIAAAESSGLIHQLGTWVLEAACRQAQEWRRLHINFGRMSVNVSPRQFDSPDFVPHLKCLLKATGLPGSALDLELTETAVMRDPDRAVHQLSELLELGVTTTLDDFGTGHSSMSLLSRLPFSRLKIDASFVAGLPNDGGNRAIAGAMTTLAHELGMTITAEGVERDEQAEFLREHGCDEFQGYWFGGPVPAEHLFPLLCMGGRTLPDA